MISVSTVVCDGYEMARGFAILADAGVQRVEPAFIEGYVEFDETSFSDTHAAQMRSALANAGLDALALSAHVDLGFEESADQLKRRLDFASAIGARILITNASTLPHLSAFYTALNVCLPHIESLGITLALENPGHGEASIIPDGKTGTRLIKRLGHPQVRLNYDVGNAITYGHLRGALQDDLAAALPSCAHLHFKDVIEDGRDWNFCAIGDGIVDYRSVLATMADTQIPLPIGLELPLRLTRPKRGDPVRRSEHATIPAIHEAVRTSMQFVV
ncbi:MAG: sugar phosphate isomerase/epimerase family protein [Hyphomicrobiales bacterium]|jgi:sugar phosphate isomerase/epimerase